MIRRITSCVSLALLLLGLTAEVSGQEKERSLYNLFRGERVPKEKKVEKPEEKLTITGYVYDAITKAPLTDVQIYSANAEYSEIADSLGHYELEVNSRNALLRFTLQGYLQQEVALYGRKELHVFLQPQNTFMYRSEYLTAEGARPVLNKTGNAMSLEKNSMTDGHAILDNVLLGRMAGLRVTNKSGMPGEGSVILSRGLRTLTAENTPLMIVDGIPYFPDLENSSVVQGFSRSAFVPVNMRDVKNITFLRGADAAIYGSMGSNGVLVVETERSNATETEIMFHTTEGIGMMKRRVPVLNATDFKSYIGDLAATRYLTQDMIVDRFPFLKDDPLNPENYLYANDTKWQDEIYRPSFTTNNSLRVMGGDAIAKYALSVGAQTDKGVMESTQFSKYYTRLNADIFVNKKFSLIATAAFNYSEYKLQEQGLSAKTSPFMAALGQGPIFSVYKQDRHHNNLPHFNPTADIFDWSNPTAMVAGIEGHNKSYDVFVDFGGRYKISKSLRADLILGLYYNYMKEGYFVPGNTSGAITPMINGVRTNTLRAGSNEGLNYYLKFNSSYERLFNGIHFLSTSIGYQLMASRREADWGSGMSIKSDFYKSLGNVDAAYGRLVSGYLNKWNWMSLYLTASYDYKKQLFFDFTVVGDASSSYGESHARMVFLPTAKIGWALKNSSFLRNVESVEQLTLRAEYGMNANSRYSSKYGRYYYQTVPYRDLAGTIRVGLPNSKLGPEKVITANVGLDFSLLGNRFHLSADVFQEETKNMLVDRIMGPAYGDQVMYDNLGEMRSRGAEISLDATIIDAGNFRWMVGGNIATYETKVLNMGNVKERLFTSPDGTTLIAREGDAPYSFYGYRAEKVFVSSREVEEAGYMAHSGRLFNAGDVKFYDVNGDKIINEEDCMVLGSPDPDFYGGFYTNFSYKGFSLFANFSYVYGNELYNAVRRSGESMNDFSNQFVTTKNRWTYEGQGTNMPRAVYGDPMDNNRFSSRWIEDGSYLKLKEVTLSYDINKKVWFFNSLKVYVTGENLYTWTKYVGMDPEFAYSYDAMMTGVDLGKVPLPKSAKIGVILNF